MDRGGGTTTSSKRGYGRGKKKDTFLREGINPRKWKQLKNEKGRVANFLCARSTIHPCHNSASSGRKVKKKG